LLWRYWFSALLGCTLLLALREPVAEGGQHLLSDRLHVGAGHIVRQSTELGFGQRRVESRKVLVFSELFADGVRTPDHHDAGPDQVFYGLWPAGDLDRTDAFHGFEAGVAWRQ